MITSIRRHLSGLSKKKQDIASIARGLKIRVKATRHNVRHAIFEESKGRVRFLWAATELLKTDQTMSDVDRDRTLSNIQRDVTQLEHFINQYHCVANADKPINIDTAEIRVIWLFSELEERYRFSNLEVQIEQYIKNASVSIPFECVYTIMSSLIDEILDPNPKTTVEVQVRKFQKDAGLLEVLLTNDGPDEVAYKIFESETDGSSLVLIKKLLEAYDGSIALLPTDNHGTIQVTMPYTINLRRR
jgi:hypothetical protein